MAKYQIMQDCAGNCIAIGKAANKRKAMQILTNFYKIYSKLEETKVVFASETFLSILGPQHKDIAIYAYKIE